MKALREAKELLIDVKIDVEKEGVEQFGYIETKLEVIIAELEALQQRSCEECVHRSFIDEALTNKVTNGFCIENGFFTKRDFCCNRYEPKLKEQ